MRAAKRRRLIDELLSCLACRALLHIVILRQSCLVAAAAANALCFYKHAVAERVRKRQEYKRQNECAATPIEFIIVTTNKQKVDNL